MEPPKLPRVGFVGLGIMGTPMAAHLAAASCLCSVYDISYPALQVFAERCPEIPHALTPAELAQASDLVITMLPDGQVVRAVTLGPQGLREGLKPGMIMIDTSSSQPWHTRSTAAELNELGVTLVDAPVSGAQWGAEAAELVFMVGGDPDSVTRVRPILDKLGRAVFHVGPIGSGHLMKSINNAVTAVTLQGVLEGLALGIRAGLDGHQMNNVFNECTAGSWITRTHVEQRILSGRFDDPFRLALMRKDIDIAVEIAHQYGVDLPMTELGATSYRSADTEAGPGVSISEIGRWLERHTGISFAHEQTRTSGSE